MLSYLNVQIDKRIPTIHCRQISHFHNQGFSVHSARSAVNIGAIQPAACTVCSGGASEIEIVERTEFCTVRKKRAPCSEERGLECRRIRRIFSSFYKVKLI